MQKYWEDLVWEHVVRAFGMGVPHGSLMNKKTTTFSVDKILHFEPYNISFFCQDCFSKQEPHSDHFPAMFLVLA